MTCKEKDVFMQTFLPLDVGDMFLSGDKFFFAGLPSTFCKL